MGLENADNFFSAALQGYQTGKQMQRREKQAKRQQEKHERQQQLGELQLEAKRNQIESQRAQRRRKEANRSLETARKAHELGQKDMAVAALQDGLSSLDMSAEDVSPETFRALEKVRKGIKNPDQVDQKETIEAANVAFKGAVNKGIGKLDKPKTVNGKKVTEITDKRIAEVAPAPKESEAGNESEPGVMARMQVTGKTKDGETVTWRAPLTRNRTTENDDPAQSVPMDTVAKQVVGRQKLIQGLANSPEFRDIVQLAQTRAGGEARDSERWVTVRGETVGKPGGLYQQNTATGELKEIAPPPDGSLNGSGQGNDPLSASYYNSAARSVEEAFATDQDQFGSPIVPEERRDLAREANALAQRLLRRSNGRISPGEAASHAVQIVKQDAPTMTKGEARNQAAKEYNQRFNTGITDFSGSEDPPDVPEEKWIEARSEEIRDQSAPSAQSTDVTGATSRQGQPSAQGPQGTEKGQSAGQRRQEASQSRGDHESPAGVAEKRMRRHAQKAIQNGVPRKEVKAIWDTAQQALQKGKTLESVEKKFLERMAEVTGKAQKAGVTDNNPSQEASRDRGIVNPGASR